MRQVVLLQPYFFAFWQSDRIRGRKEPLPIQHFSCMMGMAETPKIKYRKRVKLVVELDQFKYTLSTYEKPLVEVRDSL